MTIQRISGGGLFALSFDDNAAGDEIQAGGISIKQTGGVSGFKGGSSSPRFFPYFDCIQGGGLFGLAVRHAVKTNTILAGGISLNGVGVAEPGVLVPIGGIVRRRSSSFVRKLKKRHLFGPKRVPILTVADAFIPMPRIKVKNKTTGHARRSRGHRTFPGFPEHSQNPPFFWVD